MSCVPKIIHALISGEYLLLMQPFSALTKLFKPVDVDALPPLEEISPGPETKEALLADQEALDRAAARLRSGSILELDEQDGQIG